MDPNHQATVEFSVQVLDCVLLYFSGVFGVSVCTQKPKP